MSSRKQRLAAPVVELPRLCSLEGRLRAAGVSIPDQAQARYTMGLYLLGFDESVPAWRTRFALYRRFTRRWVLFRYERYHASKSLQEQYGAVPGFVKEIAEHVKVVAPDASLTVKAQRSDDPWLIATTETEEVIVAGWVHTPAGLVRLA